jgi:hypothetical protein
VLEVQGLGDAADVDGLPAEIREQRRDAALGGSVVAAEEHAPARSKFSQP